MDGLVDGYCGPAASRERAEADGPVDAATLVDEAEALARDIDAWDGDPQRARWLTPECVVSEGIATIASERALGPRRSTVSRSCSRRTASRSTPRWHASSSTDGRKDGFRSLSTEQLTTHDLHDVRRGV